MLGISIYPNLINANECKKYIELAQKYGFKRIFTNFIEVETEEDLNKFKDVCNFAKEKGFEIIFDVNPIVFETLKKEIKDPLLFFKEMGGTGIRMDEEFDGKFEADFTRNKHGMKLEVNASSTTGLIDNIIKHNGNLENIIACHNFYPQSYTGLDRKLFEEKCMYYKSLGIRVAAFIGSQSKKAIGPWPLNEGLPTIEDHRHLSIFDQAKDFMASGLLDDIIISNQPASEQELKQISLLNENSFNFSIKLEKGISKTEYDALFNSKVEYLGKTIFNSVRQDYSPYMIRCSAPRIKYSKTPIKAKKTNIKTFKVGDVLVLNELSGRYNGEVQIVTKEMPYDKRKNLVGKLSSFDKTLFKYIKPNIPINFIELKNNR